MNGKLRALVLSTLACAASRAGASAVACDALGSIKIAHGTVTSAVIVSEPGPHCRVALTLTPTADSSIRVEAWLPPPARWNGKFQGVGNGGLAGDISYDALAEGLARGYATVCDRHRSRQSLQASAASRWATRTRSSTMGIARFTSPRSPARTSPAAYYGRPARHSYFVGCSQGGQEALMEAQRYPADYDGIVAGDPDYNQTHHEVGAHLWVLATLYGEPGRRLGAAQAELVGAAVNRACDALDGVRDGVLEDPRRCKFDPAALQCQSADATDCLSAAQVQAVRRLWDGPDAEAGAGYYPGLERGGEAALWGGWIVAGSPDENTHGALGLPFFRYFVYGDAAWDFRSFDFRAGPPQVDTLLGGALDAVDPDLRAFQRRGGKLIHYHGYSDPDVPPRSSIDYHDRVHALARARGEASAVDGYYRLFMVPGMGHCGGGPGPNSFDMLGGAGALGRAGLHRGASWRRNSVDDDPQRGILRTRPLCPYPRSAHYRGRGSTDDARSFGCQGPGREGATERAGGTIDMPERDRYIPAQESGKVSNPGSGRSSPAQLPLMAAVNQGR